MKHVIVGSDNPLSAEAFVLEGKGWHSVYQVDDECPKKVFFSFHFCRYDKIYFSIYPLFKLTLSGADLSILFLSLKYPDLIVDFLPTVTG